MNAVTELALADVAGEMAATRRVLERLPDDRLAWRPHAKSRTLGELAAHMTDNMGWLVHVLKGDELDFGGSPPPSVAVDSAPAIRQAFDAYAADFRAALAGFDEAEFTREWTLRVGDHVVFRRPKLVVLRSFGFTHIAHHRGQLVVYLRLLDVPVPAVMGPTADEP